mgnify:CR=1 FL=1
MRALWQIVSTLLFVFFVLLIGRLILDWVRVFAREWRPTGAVSYTHLTLPTSDLV